MYIAPFITVMAIVIIFVAERKIGEFYTTIAFLLGALTSCLSGYIGMKVAVFSNYRTTFMA